jgi:decaprenylphospho-beta-D-ribofuranose 2-oxidase
MQELTGWGRYPRIQAEQYLSEDLESITTQAVLTRGLGRSYGDASLPPVNGGSVACARLANRLISFDASNGILHAEAGFSLAELHRIFLARGWASPVIPGTQFVTLGGMVASDVHGKNHHVAGCFGEHVRAIKLRIADGRLLEVSETSEPELFKATIGGMGLTGHILDVQLKLEPIPSPWIWSESEQVANLDGLLDGLAAARETWPMTVSWVDCLSRGKALGRGILIKGRWAEPHEAPVIPPAPPAGMNLPVDIPGWVLSRWTLGILNTLYYHRHRKPVRRGIVNPYAFFHPLDAVRNWNRAYGRQGFTQYQCVLPAESNHSVIRNFFEELNKVGGSSLLSIIKDCGAEGKGLMSFPAPGITIALDIAMRGEHTQRIVDALNAFVINHGGRIYLAKDALTRPEDFRSMEPRLTEFNRVRRHWDPQNTLRSALSERLLGDSR